MSFNRLLLAILSPAYFGMVMATGLVSITAHLLGLPRVVNALFQLKSAVAKMIRISCS